MSQEIPDQPRPEITFKPEQVQYLVEFTDDLKKLPELYAHDPDEVRFWARQIVDTELQMLSDQRDQGDMTTEGELFVVASTATGLFERNQAREALRLVEQTGFLNHEDQGVLTGMVTSKREYREYKIPPSEKTIAAGLSSKVGPKLAEYDSAIEQGANKGNIRLALTAYRAGVTLATAQTDHLGDLDAEIRRHTKT